MDACLRSLSQSSAFPNDSPVSGLTSIIVAILKLYAAYSYSVSAVFPTPRTNMKDRDNPFRNLAMAIAEPSLVLQ